MAVKGYQLDNPSFPKAGIQQVGAMTPDYAGSGNQVPPGTPTPTGIGENSNGPRQFKSNTSAPADQFASAKPQGAGPWVPSLPWEAKGSNPQMKVGSRTGKPKSQYE